MALVRTFVAIELTAEVLQALEKTQQRLARGQGGRAGRWAKAEGIHLTLKFLGEIPSERMDAVCQAVANACRGHGPLDLVIADLGCFPDLRRPRVIWAGVRGETGRLAALQRDVEGELGKLGFPREERAFTPHLTLARISDRASGQEIEVLGKTVAEYRLGELAPMRASEVSVMKSELSPEGAHYTELFKAPLAAP